MNPLVSILTPTYNRPHYFEQALQSAMNQTYSNIEIIVCDNSEDDRTESVVNRYLSAPNGNKIRYVRHGDNIGPIANQRKCMELAKGEYINYLNDDDLFHPQKIELMMKWFLNYNGIALVTSQRRLIDVNGQRIYVPPIWSFKKLYDRDTIVDGKTFIRMLLRDKINYIGEPTTVLFRRNCLKEPYGVLAGKPVFFKVDLACWLNLLTQGKGVYMVQPLSFLRYHQGQLSQHPLKKIISRLDREAFQHFEKKWGKR